mgnify:FL=1
MPIPIEMPRLSDTMEEGTLIKWHKAVGDEVSAGETIADVETDKATMELQAFDDGTVARLDVEEGSTVPVGQTILILAGDGESVEDAAKAAPGSGGGGNGQAKAEEDDSDEEAEGADQAEGGEEAQDAEEQGKTQGEAPKQAAGGAQSAADTPEHASAGETGEVRGDVAGNVTSSGGGGVRISPLARKLADEHGLDISQIRGSGPDGRIIKKDVLAAAEGGQGKAGKQAPAQGREAEAAAPAAQAQKVTPQPATAPAPSGEPAALEAKSLPLSNMRKTIAKRLVESKTQVPHFQVSVDIDMDPLLALRKTLNTQLEAQGVKLSVNDFVVRATAVAATMHPQCNSSWNGDTIEQHGTVNVGVAIALPAERGGGLLVATNRDTHAKGLRQISSEVKAIAKKAREYGLSIDEMEGSTITLSNLGMYDVTSFTAIINPPNAAIIAVGSAQEKPVVKDGEITVGHVMTATVSGDHRVIDGAIAAEYLGTFKNLLENPAGLLV